MPENKLLGVVIWHYINMEFDPSAQYKVQHS